MKKIKLISLKLENFKGLSFTHDFEGKNSIIEGQNGVGKTTLFDAFNWLLFNKDSLDRSNFEIKNIKNESIENRMEHIVECVLKIDGKEIRLKKIYKETWKKKRGDIEENLTGHTNIYYIDDVPDIKEKDFKAKIDSIIDERSFKLLTNPLYFNNILLEKDRREIITELIGGDVSVDEVVKSNSDLEEIKEMLLEKPVKDLLKIHKDNISKLNKEIDTIPTLISENKRMLTNDIDYSNIEKLKENLSNLELEKKDLENNIIRDKNLLFEIIQDKNKEIVDLEEQKKNLSYGNEKTKEQIKHLNKTFQENIDKLTSNEKQIISINEVLKSENKRRNELLTDFQKIKSEKLEDCNCPTCKQVLPENLIKDFQKQLEESKSARLKEIQNKGLVIRNSLDQNQKEIDLLQLKNNDLDKLNFEITGELEELKKQIKVIDSTEIDKKIDNVKNQIKELNDQIKNINYEEQSNEFNEKINKINKEISIIESNQKIESRIKELEADNKKYNDEYRKHQKIVFLLEQFLQTKVELLDTKINTLFDNLKIKLFDIQVNGGLKPTFEILIKTDEGNYIPFSNSSTGEKIKAGLEIISNLSKYYDISCPIWIDNAESITKEIASNSQIIKLFASSEHEKLNIRS